MCDLNICELDHSGCCYYSDCADCKNANYFSGRLVKFTQVSVHNEFFSSRVSKLPWERQSHNWVLVLRTSCWLYWKGRDLIYYTEKTTEHGFSLDGKNFWLTPIGWHILTIEYVYVAAG